MFSFLRIKFAKIIILTFENDEEAETLFTAPFKLLLIVEFFVEAPISSHLEDLLSLVSFSSFNFSYKVYKNTSGINHTVSTTINYYNILDSLKDLSHTFSSEIPLLESTSLFVFLLSLAAEASFEALLGTGSVVEDSSSPS